MNPTSSLAQEIKVNEESTGIWELNEIEIWLSLFF